MNIIDRLKRRWVRDLVAETEFAVWERQELWQVVPLLEDCRNLLTQLTAGISGDELTADIQTVTAATITDILRSHHAITHHVGIIHACADMCASFARLHHVAELIGADLFGADLFGAKGADLVIAKSRIIADGDIIGWKMGRDNRLIQLRIPADARRSHAMGRKCRAERAEVIAIVDKDGAPATEAFSIWDANFRYTVGTTVTPKESFDEDMWAECSSGVHFYITRIEAEHHV